MLSKVRCEVLTTGESGRWNEVLEEIGRYDFYHLPSYSELAEKCGEGTAVMPVFRDGDHVAAFPMLVRDIDGTDCRDVTSVYGYAGPVVTRNMPEETRRAFLDSLQDHFKSNRIITAFARLHTLLDQPAVLAGFGEVLDIGFTVSIDLTQPRETQRAAYRKSHRYEIERLRKNGFTCEEVGADHLGDFVRIYHETMDKIGADSYYYFDTEYFEHLIHKMPGVTHVWVCRDGDKIACAALFMLCGGIIQYHLSGTATEYLKLAPNKLMLDAVREWGTEIGAHTLHLGGGVGSKRDSLFKFKQGFSEREHVYSIWRHVCDPELYQELCREACTKAGVEPEGSYFPLYRDPALRRGQAG